MKGERIPTGWALILTVRQVSALIEMLLRYIPGGLGFKLRYWYYKPRVKHMGRNVLIDVGVFLNGVKNISIGDYTWIDAGCRIDAMLGEVSLGRRIHVAPFTIVAAREPITLEDYVGLSSFVRIYSNSEHPTGGKRMSGPMVPEEHKAFRSQPVVLRKDSFVGSGAVLLPGAELGEGAVVGANAVISKPVDPWSIVVGTGKVVGTRDTVTVPDI